MLTLLDIAKLNGSDKVIGLIEENMRFSPELTVFPFTPKAGTTVISSKRTSFPAGGFVQGSGGIAPGKSSLQQQLSQMFPYLSVIQVPKAITMAYDGGMGALEMIEASGVMKQSFLNIGGQIWNGNAGKVNVLADGVTPCFSDPNGFPGIQQLVAVGGTSPIVNALGNTANTASSVYAIKFGEQDVSGIIGLNSSFELSPFRDQQIQDVNGAWLPGRVADLMAWPGLFVGNKNCMGRIYNLTADAGCTLNDKFLATLIAAFPIGFRPDAIFMSRRSRLQLQTSRTVVLHGDGNLRPDQPTLAPTPTDYDGIKIYATDSIPDTDPIGT